MKKKNSLILVGASLAIAVTWAGTKASRAGYEGPEYDVVSKSGTANGLALVHGS